VRLVLEKRIPFKLVAEEMGVSHDSVRDWVKRYQKLGESGVLAAPEDAVQEDRREPGHDDEGGGNAAQAGIGEVAGAASAVSGEGGKAGAKEERAIAAAIGDGG